MNEGVSIVTGIIFLFNITTTKNTKIEIPVTNLNIALSDIVLYLFTNQRFNKITKNSILCLVFKLLKPFFSAFA
jgi:hypothetical protein